MENQDKQVNTGCEARLTRCETKLDMMAKMLKTQDSLSASLRSELNTYKKIGVIK